jgi:hypothetical protein
MLIHDDGCGAALDADGMCPRCKFHPDMQSTAVVKDAGRVLVWRRSGPGGSCPVELPHTWTLDDALKVAQHGDVIEVIATVGGVASHSYHTVHRDGPDCMAGARPGV